MGSRHAKAPSIWDVAKVAGVSHQTVSRVVNGTARVTEPTRAKVMAAIAELGYRQNRFARTLAGGALQSVTVLTTDTSLYGAAETLRGIEVAARVAGFSVSVSVLDPDEALSDADVLARLPHAKAPAIIIAHDDTTSSAMQALRAAQPLTTVATGGENLGGLPNAAEWLVWLDDRTVAAEATAHLLDLGHRTVHHLAIPSKAQRGLGWVDALAVAGREVPPSVRCGWSMSSAYEAARPLVADRNVTAILAGNDDLALGALRAARDAGREVPGDLSIVGFDDCPFAAYLEPPLTTVDLDFFGVGHGAFELLRRKLDGDGERHAAPSWRAPELIVRATSGPPDRHD